MMMLFITMIQRIGANTQSQHDHPCFKESIVNDIDAKQRQTAEKQWQQGTMYGAGQRSPDSYSIPGGIILHNKAKILKATWLQKL